MVLKVTCYPREVEPKFMVRTAYGEGSQEATPENCRSIAEQGKTARANSIAINSREIEQCLSPNTRRPLLLHTKLAMRFIRKLFGSLRCSWHGFFVLTIGMRKYQMWASKPLNVLFLRAIANGLRHSY